MKLIPNVWREIKRLWSIRLTILQGLLQGLYAAWPAFQDVIPPVIFAGLSMLLAVLTLVARVVKQKEPDDEPPEAE